MRKRRKLANKLTIMVCAVLCVVSAFFYAPMDVQASSGSVSGSGVESGVDSYPSGYIGSYSSVFSLVSGLDSDTYYSVNLSYALNITGNVSVLLRNLNIIYGSSYESGLTLGYFIAESYSTDYHKNNFYESDVTIIGKGSDFVNKCLYFRGRCLNTDSSTSNLYDFNYVFDYSINSITPLTNEDSGNYQQGYNAGYSAGEQAGYGNGYSNGFADGEASVDSDAIYDEAFQAGKDSVDTQSYYDAGYQAGYDAAYSAGYESGYDVGYQSAMDRVENWGADTSDYPLLISQTDGTFDLQFDFIEVGSDGAVYSDYNDSERFYTGIEFNPNHTYRLDFTYHDFSYEYDSFFTPSFSFWLYWGDSAFPLIVGSKDDITTSVFIPGDRISNGLRFRCDLAQIDSNGSFDVLHYYLKGCYLKIYDMGPSGDTQNHIANQTDQLTNGFDESQGNSVNNDLSSGLNEYQTAEDSLWATATTGLKDFTFFDFESVPAMITGMSFITSIMGSWFSHAGGASGVGIVLSILFSVMLVAMVLGLYRLYQSKGGKK